MLLERINRLKEWKEGEGDNSKSKTFILMIFSSTFPDLCQNPVVSGEGDRSKQEMALPLPSSPHKPSQTPCTPGADTSNLWFSHPNEH